MKKALIWIIICAVLIVGGVCIGVAAVSNSPRVIFKNSFSDLTQNMVKREELAPVFKTLEGGSAELEVYVDNYDGNKHTLEIGGKAYFNARKAKVMLDDLYYSDGTNQYTGELFYSPDLMYADLPELLDGTYGLVRGEAAESFAGSIYAYGSDHEYALSEDDYKVAYEALSAYDDNVIKDFSKDFSKVMKRYSKKFDQLLKQYAEFETKNIKMRFDDERKEVRSITMTLSGENLCYMIEDLYQELKSDKKVKALVEEYGDLFSDTLEIMGVTDLENGIDAGSAYEDLLEKMSDAIDRMMQDIPDYDIHITLITPKNSCRMIQLSVSTGIQGGGLRAGGTLMTVNFGYEGIKKSEHIKVTALDETVLEYEITQNTANRYNANCKIMGEEVMTIAYNRKTSDLRVVLSNLDGEKVVLHGSLEKKWGKILLSFETVSITYVVADEPATDDQTNDDLDWEYDFNRVKHTETVKYNVAINLTLKTTDFMPSAQKDINSIFEIDYKEFMKKFEKLVEDVPIVD